MEVKQFSASSRLYLHRGLPGQETEKSRPFEIYLSGKEYG
jgi:hypothetical protein